MKTKTNIAWFLESISRLKWQQPQRIGVWFMCGMEKIIFSCSIFSHKFRPDAILLNLLCLHYANKTRFVCCIWCTYRVPLIPLFLIRIYDKKFSNRADFFYIHLTNTISDQIKLDEVNKKEKKWIYFFSVIKFTQTDCLLLR